jgi:hypothetical protein
LWGRRRGELDRVLVSGKQVLAEFKEDAGDRLTP